METLRHGINGYSIPAYMEEILTHNYCPCFIRMSIIKEGQSYRFTYRPGRLTRLRTDELDYVDKMQLFKTLISVNDSAQSYLIGAENYLIEPELVYTDQSLSIAPGNIRLLFYPDIKRMSFSRKMMLMTERIRKQSSRDEQELLSQIREAFESGDVNRARLILEKNILRAESRNLVRAG